MGALNANSASNQSWQRQHQHNYDRSNNGNRRSSNGSTQCKQCK
nr:MAG TPA: hypothetical protein [Microviridae sp.]